MATYDPTGAVLGLLRGGNNVHGAVEPPMCWLQATVTLVPHVVELRPPLLRIAFVVLGYSNTTGNTLTSYTLTS